MSRTSNDRPNFGNDVQRAVRHLRAGGVIVFPTDTLYGLGAVIWNAEAIRRVVQIKGRHEGKGMPVLIAQAEDALQLVEDSVTLRQLADEFWPGGLTVVARARPGLSPLLLGPDGSLGIRVPAAQIARSLIEQAGAPLLGTSANRSGAAAALTAAEAWESIGRDVDYVLDGGPARGKPSTVVDISNNPPRILRCGSVATAAVRRILPAVQTPPGPR